jgi:hypothetical protein
MDSDLSSTRPGQSQRFRSLELAVTTSIDTDAIGRALTRAAMASPEWGTGSIALIPVEIADGDAWLSYKWHVWWALPALWRDDLTSSNGDTAVTIVRPDVALNYVSTNQILCTSERLGAGDKRPRVSAPTGMRLPTIDERLNEFPLIRHRLPDSDWQLEAVGHEAYLERSGRRVRAIRRPHSGPWQFGVSGFWEGVDEYECVMDEDLQILLSVTAIVDGVSAATVSVEQIGVDVAIPASTFDFSPPAGTRIAHVSRNSKE